MKPGRLKLGSSAAYDAKYKAFCQAWDALYTATMVVDGLANASQLVRSLRSIRIAFSAKQLFSAAKSCGRQADVLALWGKGADEAVQLGKYSLASISQERGFIDLLPNLLIKEGLTMDDFQYMLQKSVKALTESEKAKLARIRNAIPKPDANTVMQKVIPKTDIENYINSTSNYYKKIGGYVSTAADTKHLKTFDDLYYGERLDYTNSKFFMSANSCGIIRFKNTRSSEVVIPTGAQYNGYNYPFTAHGFTAGSNGRIGVPEWHFQSRIDFQDGTEIWEIFNDGTEELRAIYRSGKFVIIK